MRLVFSLSNKAYFLLLLYFPIFLAIGVLKVSSFAPEFKMDTGAEFERIGAERRPTLMRLLERWRRGEVLDEEQERARRWVLERAVRTNCVVDSGTRSSPTPDYWESLE